MPRVLVLGCTHFPVLKADHRQGRGAGCDAGRQRRDHRAQRWKPNWMRWACGTSGAHGRSHFLATDAPDRFSRVGEIFLGAPIDPGAVEVIDL